MTRADERTSRARRDARASRPARLRAPHPRSVRLLVGLLSVVLCLWGGAAHPLESDAAQPINIRARSVDANEKTGVSVYRGDVVVTQGSMRLEADRLEVTVRNGEAERVRAWGKPARLRLRTDSGEEIRASAERIEYGAKRRQVDLYGDAELHRDADVVTGAVIRYALDDQTFSAEGGDGGRVSAVIQPAKPAKQDTAR